MAHINPSDNAVSGAFTTLRGETYYAIYNVDQMAPFFISLVSDQDHWLFAASTGGLTAGRVSPETALFPYVTVDKIYESTPHTGPKTLVKVSSESGAQLWEPFNNEHNDRFALQRNLYKNLLGNKLCFEEVNITLGITFRYTWSFSDKYGLQREAELVNLNDTAVNLSLLDGLQNVLPAGTPRFTQTQSSNLVDAYKWTELDEQTGVAMFTLYSAITDRAEPAEALRANTVFALGLDNPQVHLSNACVDAFKTAKGVVATSYLRGVRGAYFVQTSMTLTAQGSESWRLVANLEQDQGQVSALVAEMAAPLDVAKAIDTQVEAGSDNLARIMASSDGFQATAEEEVSLHHYANTLFNVLRGGIFADQYLISKHDLIQTLAHFNRGVFARHEQALGALGNTLHLDEVRAFAENTGDSQLQRLVSDYLPITFGRRHGDPSRPWNQFAIELKDDHGQPLLSYQGNWRDIFQNWEALALSYPSFAESIIAKFVNASTMDGYNPYRITKQGIDWEVEEPDDPWSYIGYWGDHQIIYLLKLLELSRQFNPQALSALLERPQFCYANVPYRIKAYAELIANPKATVLYDGDLAHHIEERVERIGADGKLVLTYDDEVYQVTLLEKLLVPLLTKLSNLVLDGGIWLNTQRPEWNDANNALVGQGLSMVTLYYMHRYIDFMQTLLEEVSPVVLITGEVAQWLKDTTQALADMAAQMQDGMASKEQQSVLLRQLGQAASVYRERIYSHDGQFAKAEVSRQALNEMLEAAQSLIRHSIAHAKGQDGLYHAYNTVAFDHDNATVGHLYPMLEGQVSALSSGALSPQESADVLDTLFASDMFREDQKTFMLYPDRTQSRFLDKNRLPEADVMAIAPLKTMLDADDRRIVYRDNRGNLRFNSSFQNAGALTEALTPLACEFPELQDEAVMAQILALYEHVFNHQAFTGRSGGMFGFEGLGCIYWHMVSKLLLAVQENVHLAYTQGADKALLDRLIGHYYAVREGIGFNKTPLEYGAFPTDPYSHTPKHAGAQQPGMTGQVKEELLTRLGELGCFVEHGQMRFDPYLLREQEFLTEGREWRYLDVNAQWQTLTLRAGELAFTWCQVPVVYALTNTSEASLSVTRHSGDVAENAGTQLSAADSADVFARNNRIHLIKVALPQSALCQTDL